MPAGAIFISYSSGDRSAAERIAAGLSGAGLDVWLDRGALKSGDRYESKIRRHITQCDLFLPLLSRETESREEAFFRREWAWALARAEGMDRSRRFIRPLCVDPTLTPYAMQRVPEEFLKLHIGTALNGELPQELTLDLVKAVREIRSRRIS